MDTPFDHFVQYQQAIFTFRRERESGISNGLIIQYPVKHLTDKWDQRGVDKELCPPIITIHMPDNLTVHVANPRCIHSVKHWEELVVNGRVAHQEGVSHDLQGWHSAHVLDAPRQPVNSYLPGKKSMDDFADMNVIDNWCNRDMLVQYLAYAS